MARPRVVIAVVSAFLLVVAAVALLPSLTRERTPVAATGTPSPLITDTGITIKRGQRVCATGAPLGPRTQVAQIVVTDEKSSPPLELWADGPGYRSPTVQVPPQAAGRRPVGVQFTPPDHELFGRVCVRNPGRRATTLIGNPEPSTRTRLTTAIDGKPIEPDLVLMFYEDQPESMLANLGTMVAASARFAGFLSGSWLAWIVLVLTVVGVPAGLYWALYRGLRDDA